MEENKITFEDIQKANETIKTIALLRKNKKTGEVTSNDYAEVNQRIKAYRMVYPSGTIRTEIKCLKDGICLIKAEVTDENGELIGTGHAYEKENSSFINQTSYVENCETSAVGRALGMAGFGIDTSVASAEEVQNAIENQYEDKKVIMATEKQKELIRNMFTTDEIKNILTELKKSKLSELTVKEASDLISKKKQEAEADNWTDMQD